MEIVWLGNGYRKHFESLDITQEGLQELQTMFLRIYSSDNETRNLYSGIYREKYKKGKSAIEWNIGSLNSYFRNGREINSNTFLKYIAIQPKHTKRSIFYLVKDIFGRKK